MTSVKLTTLDPQERRSGAMRAAGRGPTDGPLPLHVNQKSDYDML